MKNKTLSEKIGELELFSYQCDTIGDWDSNERTHLIRGTDREKGTVFYLAHSSITVGPVEQVDAITGKLLIDQYMLLEEAKEKRSKAYEEESTKAFERKEWAQAIFAFFVLYSIFTTAIIIVNL